LETASRGAAAAARLRLQDLQETVKVLRQLPTGTPDFASVALARYLAIRAAGYIEAVRDDAADAYVSSRAPDQVVRRVRSGLRTGQGVAPGQLCEFVGSFHADWKTELEAFLSQDDESLKSSLGSLVAARKKIAHGDGETVTAGKALNWADTAQVLGQWLLERFDPNLPAASLVSR